MLLLDPKNPRTKCGAGRIMGTSDEDVFHGQAIQEGWFRVEMSDVYIKDFPLMFPYEPADQETLKDVVGSSTLWDGRFLKLES